MSLSFSRCSELSAQQKESLAKGLADFYRNPPAEYYQIADQSTGRYTADQLPFHHHLVQQISNNISVLEVGCGTAHLCREVQARGGRYTGIDYGDELLAANQQRYPEARFFKVGDHIEEKFDLVVSLYAIEHVVDPPAYLDQLLAFCRPGGMIGIICPEFIDSPAFPPSVYYGQTPRRLREKASSFALLDIISHLYEWKIAGPQWKRRIRRSLPSAFWINLKPAVLNGGNYAIDSDAIHIVGLRDLVWFLEQRGARILQTSDQMKNVPLDVLRYNAYVLAQKPEICTAP